MVYKEKKSTNVEVNRDNFGIFKKLLDVEEIWLKEETLLKMTSHLEMVKVVNSRCLSQN